MEPSRKAIRDYLKSLPRPRARAALKELLPERIFYAIYYADIEDWPRWRVGEYIHCEQSQVSRLKKRGYEILLKADFATKLK